MLQEHRIKYIYIYIYQINNKKNKKLSPINPIGDMDLESYHEEFVVNDFLRKFTSRLTKSEPATGRTHLT
jgi:hypothetical protein